jgi:SAM-dependent methyltransferase
MNLQRSNLILTGWLSVAAALLLLLPKSAYAGPENYRFGPASRDGIGKFYLGREISHVMGHLGAGWLERPTREREEHTGQLIRNLPLRSGDTVADLGAGTGYFSFPIAARIGDGTVLAVDIQPEMLAIVEARAAREGVSNIRTLLATERDPMIPPGSADLVLLVDAYHEFSHPREVMDGVMTGLRPGGLVVLVEYRGEDASVPIKPLHKMTERQARLELEHIGFEFVSNESYLPRQHVLMFRKPEGL